MSFSTVLIIVACMAAYKLGSYNAKHPGAAFRLCHEGTQTLWKWMSK